MRDLTRRGPEAERGESLIETIAALLILSIFVLTAYVAFENTLAHARTLQRLSFLDAALTQAKSKIEAEPYATSYAAPSIPPVAFAVSLNQVTAGLQIVTLTASYGTTRQVTIFKTTVDSPAGTAVGGAGGAASPPTITSAPATSAFVAQAFSYQAPANQAQATGTTPITWSLLEAPSGLGINASTGLVSWTPDTFGTFGVAIQATNTFGSDRQSFTVDVRAGPTITTTPVTAAFVSVAYSYQARAVGTQPITWSFAVAPPPGMAVDTNSGLVTWTPPSGGNFTVTLRATNVIDIVARSVDQAYTINVIVPQTVTLQPTDGWNEKTRKTLLQDGKVSDVQTSDDKRLDVEAGLFMTFQFQQSVPSGATVLSVKVFVEHFEEEKIGQGLILWQVGGGALATPTVFQSFAPPVRLEKANEGTDEWDVTSVIDTAAKVYDLKFVVRNNNSVNAKTFIDRVSVVVVYVP